MTPWLIYCHTITVPDGSVRRYIGQTNTSMRARWLAHVRSSKANTFGTTNRFHLAISRYGADAWTHEELEWCLNRFDAKKREKYWIKHFRTMDKEHGFNIQNGG